MNQTIKSAENFVKKTTKKESDHSRKDKEKERFDLAFAKTPDEERLVNQGNFKKAQNLDMDVDIYNLDDNPADDVELETGGDEKEAHDF